MSANQFPKSRLTRWDTESLSRLRRLGVVFYEHTKWINFQIGVVSFDLHAHRGRYRTKVMWYPELLPKVPSVFFTSLSLAFRRRVRELANDHPESALELTAILAAFDP